MPQERVALEKKLKPHWVWAIAFGSAIGWGSFVLPTEWMAAAGPMGVILGFWIGGALLSLVGVSAGYLIKAYPVTGGAFTYAYLAFGRKHAFFCGWFLIMGYAAIVALNASAFALMIKFIAPKMSEVVLLYNMGGWNVYLGEILIASAVLIIFAWLNVRGADATAQIQFYFCVVLLAAAIGVTLGMMVAPSTSFQNMAPLFKPDIPVWSAVAAIVAISPWAYVGFDTVPQAAEEFNFSPGKALFLILVALAIAAAHYSLMIVATALAMPWEALVARQDIWGTGQGVMDVLGGLGLAALVIALVMGICTGLIGFYISCSRLMFAMSRAKALPPAFSMLHPTHRTPFLSITFICLVCLIAPWFGRPVLLWIVDMSAVGISIAFIYYCAAAYRLFKWSANGTGSAYCREVAPFKKSVALLGTICSFGFLGLLLIPGSPGFLSVPAWIVLLAWSVLGLIFYFTVAQTYCNLTRGELDQLVVGKAMG